MPKSWCTTPSVTMRNAVTATLREYLLELQMAQHSQLRRWAQRLSMFTDLGKYSAPDAPRWRTHPGYAGEGEEVAVAFQSALDFGDCRRRGLPQRVQSRLPASTSRGGVCRLSLAGCLSNNCPRLMPPMPSAWQPSTTAAVSASPAAPSCGRSRRSTRDVTRRLPRAKRHRRPGQDQRCLSDCGTSAPGPHKPDDWPGRATHGRHQARTGYPRGSPEHAAVGMALPRGRAQALVLWRWHALQTWRQP